MSTIRVVENVGKLAGGLRLPFIFGKLGLHCASILPLRTDDRARQNTLVLAEDSSRDAAIVQDLRYCKHHSSFLCFEGYINEHTSLLDTS